MSQRIVIKRLDRRPIIKNEIRQVAGQLPWATSGLQSGHVPNRQTLVEMGKAHPTFSVVTRQEASKMTTGYGRPEEIS